MLERYAALKPNHPLFEKKPDDIRKHIEPSLRAAVYVDVAPFETTVPQSHRDYSYFMRSNGFSATFMPASALQVRDERVYVLRVSCELPSEEGHPIVLSTETADDFRVADVFLKALGIKSFYFNGVPSEHSLARRLVKANKLDIVRYAVRQISKVDVFEDIS